MACASVNITQNRENCDLLFFSTAHDDRGFPVQLDNPHWLHGSDAQDPEKVAKVVLMLINKYKTLPPVEFVKRDIEAKETGIKDLKTRLKKTRYITLLDLPGGEENRPYSGDEREKKVIITDKNGMGYAGYPVLHLSYDVEPEILGKQILYALSLVDTIEPMY